MMVVDDVPSRDDLQAFVVNPLGSMLSCPGSQTHPAACHRTIVRQLNPEEIRTMMRLYDVDRICQYEEGRVPVERNPTTTGDVQLLAAVPYPGSQLIGNNRNVWLFHLLRDNQLILAYWKTVGVPNEHRALSFVRQHLTRSGWIMNVFGAIGGDDIIPCGVPPGSVSDDCHHVPTRVQ